MKTYMALLALLITSGCLCCCSGPDMYLGGQDVEVETECPPPYMEYGSGCCLDADSNRVCDDMEEEAAKEVVQVTMTTATTSTTETSTSSTSTTNAPTTTLKSTYACVENAGYDPDSFIYVHSNRCGGKYTDEARTTSSRKGVEVTLIDIGILEEDEIMLLECFYGQYYDGNPAFSECPKLLCPRTGEIEIVDGRRPVMSQMSGFALDCK